MIILVGPSGSGKTTLTRMLESAGYNAMDSEDKRLKVRYPLYGQLYLQRPWRYWANKGGSREEAMAWERVQAYVTSTEATLHEFFSCHPGAYLNSNFPQGNCVTVMLNPAPWDVVLKQRGSEHLDKKVWESSRKDYLAKVPDIVAKAHWIGSLYSLSGTLEQNYQRLLDIKNNTDI